MCNSEILFVILLLLVIIIVFIVSRFYEYKQKRKLISLFTKSVCYFGLGVVILAVMAITGKTDYMDITLYTVTLAFMEGIDLFFDYLDEKGKLLIHE